MSDLVAVLAPTILAISNAAGALVVLGSAPAGLPLLAGAVVISVGLGNVVGRFVWGRHGTLDEAPVGPLISRGWVPGAGLVLGLILSTWWVLDLARHPSPALTLYQGVFTGQTVVCLIAGIGTPLWQGARRARR
jgi:hypothetical protein